MANTNDYGFYALRHLYAQRLSQVDIQRVYTAVQETTAQYNLIANGLLANWSQPTEIAQMQFELAGSGTMQPLDEKGNPLPVRPSGSYQVAFPIQGAGTAWGDNRITRELMTVEEVQRSTLDALRRDADWLIRHMLAALLDNTTWTYEDLAGRDGYKGLGSITIQPLANGDSVTYVRKGNQVAATDDHYLAQAGAIADNANPYPLIYNELVEHPSNMNGEVTAYIASSLVATTQALATFYPLRDPRLDYGDTITLAQGEQFTDVGIGEKVLGRANRVKIVEMPSLPSGYIVAKVDGKAPLRQREYPSERLKGLFPERHSPDGNLNEYRWLRYCGFGVADRVSAVVYQIGNGTYQIPSGYATPLPV